MSNHWERKMNPPRKKAPAVRRHATREQIHRAYDMIMDGASRRETARTLNISEGAIMDFPGWTPQEVKEWSLMGVKREENE